MGPDGGDPLEVCYADGFRDHTDQTPAPGAVNEDWLQHRSAGDAAEIIANGWQPKPAHVDPAAAVELAAKLVVSVAGQSRYGAM